MKPLQTKIAGLVVVLLLAGCAQAIIQPTGAPQDVSTAVPTLAFTPTKPTGTPIITSTPLPSATRRATWTDSGLTKTTTVTPLASFTRMPTSKASKTASPTITPTITLYVRPPLIFTTRTATPIPFACDAIEAYPKWGQVFRPRTDFIAKWKLINTGDNMWHMDDVAFGYVRGTKMHSRDRVDVVLSTTVYRLEKLNLQVHLKAPKEPGMYATAFGLWKTNKKGEPFCVLEIVIEVAK